MLQSEFHKSWLLQAGVEGSKEELVCSVVPLAHALNASILIITSLVTHV